MYALMEDGIQIALYGSIQACQAAASIYQYCIFVN